MPQNVCRKALAPCMHPKPLSPWLEMAGTTMRANARLSPPNGYVGYFDWGSYLEEETALAAPPSIFTSTKVFPSFKGDVSVRFELWHRIEATVLPTPPSPEQQERDANRANK